MELKHVSGDQRDAMRVLADGLARALELAGLPAYVDLNGDVE